MLENKWFRAALIAFVILVIAGVQIRQALQIERFSNITVTAGFNTEFRLIGLTRSRREFDEKFDLFRSTIAQLNTIFDRYSEYEGINSVYTINRMAGIAPVKVDPQVIKLLDIAKSMYDLSNGIFDVTSGAVFEIWHEYREIARFNGGIGPVPDFERLANAALCTGWDLVVIDRTQSTVFLTRPCASLDLGGIAKGYAADVAKNALIQAGMHRGLISAGLSSINTLGLREDNTPWNIGVADRVENITVPFNVAISTSGIDQQNYIDVNGVFYHHLINPKTQLPANYFRSVVVVSEDATLGDALSTILFLKPIEEGMAFMQRLQARYPDTFFGAIWVFEQDKRPDPSVIATRASTQQVVVNFQTVEIDVWFAITENLKPYAASFNP